MTQDPEMTPCGVSTGLRSRNPNPNPNPNSQPRVNSPHPYSLNP
jgi:hypothetical protein